MQRLLLPHAIFCYIYGTLKALGLRKHMLINNAKTMEKNKTSKDAMQGLIEARLAVDNQIRGCSAERSLP